MSELSNYLCRATEYCAETRNLIEDVINSVARQNDFLSVDAKKAILRDALQGMGFSDEQITAFAKDELPTEYQIVPVEVSVREAFRVYVRVPVGAGLDEVCNAAKEHILKNGVSEIDMAPDYQMEGDDILDYWIDWGGVENE